MCSIFAVQQVISEDRTEPHFSNFNRVLFLSACHLSSDFSYTLKGTYCAQIYIPPNTVSESSFNLWAMTIILLGFSNVPYTKTIIPLTVSMLIRSSV